MAEDPQKFVLNVAFFLQKTKARQARVAQLVKALKLPKPDKDHVLNAEFASADQWLSVHVDQGKYGGSSAYYVQLHAHGRNSATTPDAKQSPAWAYDELARLVGEKPIALAFFDADLTVSDVSLPPAFIATPISIGGRALPVMGVEYGMPLDKGVYKFGWVRESGGIAVRVSYSVDEYQASSLPDAVEREKIRVTGFIREAFRS